LRQQFPVLQADAYRHLPDDPLDDSIQWLNGDGLPMREEHWHEHHNQLLGYLLTENANPGAPCFLLVIFNAAPDTESFTLPVSPAGDWRLYVDTALDDAAVPTAELPGRSVLAVTGRSLQILTSGREPDLPQGTPLRAQHQE
jgi:pullulanase/glycogen debranching enzyme